VAIRAPSFVSSNEVEELVRIESNSNNSFVIKTHTNSPEHESLVNSCQLTLFTSGKVAKKLAVHNQNVKNLLNCSLCEVDYYKPIFNLSNEQVDQLKQYMSYYVKLRRCCGYQSSQYEMLRIHKCDVREFQHLLEYPWCEKENLTQIELDFVSSSRIPTNDEMDPQRNWAEPGDCNRFPNEIVSKKKWFNMRDFRGCKAETEKIQLELRRKRSAAPRNASRATMN